MFISDLVDEDAVRHRRQQPVSTFFFAVRSSFTVWADSLVPMAVVALMVARGADPRETPSSPGQFVGFLGLKFIFLGV